MRIVQSVGNLEQQFLEIVNNALDRRLFTDVTSPGTPDTEFAITHGLGFIPLGFLVISTDKAGSVYKSTTPATPEAIYLKSSVATAQLRIMVF